MTDKRHGQLSSATVETIAGLSAGLISTAIVHPLDIIKTRLQIDSRRSSSTTLLGSSLRTLRLIIKNEGPTHFAALYRGLTPNLVGNSASWGLYFLWYARAQDLIRSYRSYSPTQQLSTVDYLTASSISGTLTAILTNPIWVVKTRMLSTPASSSGAYPSLLSGLRSIYTTEGLRGYFAGLTPALFGVSHGALYFAVYERLKAVRRDAHADRQISNLDTILTSSAAKVCAGVATYPHQLVRTRMQNYGAEKPGLMRVIRNVWREEGVMAFYKGLGPNLVRVVPSTCVTFLVYENVRYGLPRVWDRREEGPV